MLGSLCLARHFYFVVTVTLGITYLSEKMLFQFVSSIFIIITIVVLIGAFISIFPNRLKAEGLEWSESFETCCQWALLNVQVVTLLFPFTVQKYINFILLSAKCMLGLFMLSHST